MKKILLIILILTDTLVIAQFHKNYSWSEKTIITQEIDSSFQKSSIGLLNKYIVEFKDTSDSANTSFDKYLTRHTIVRILAEDGIKYHKTLYIPMYNSDNLIDLKVRIIDSTGNIINFDGSNLYEVENEEFSKNFKTYELTDLMVNSIVECIYTTKEKSEIHGSQILQEDYFNTKTEFILIPNNFKSKVKPYNTNEVFNSELINNVKAKKITINNLNPVSNEEYSTAQANRVNISYQCYKADKISSQSEFWKNITNSIYPIAFPKNILMN